MNNNKYCKPEANAFERDLQLVRRSQETDTFDVSAKTAVFRMSSTAGLATSEQTRRVLTRAGVLLMVLCELTNPGKFEVLVFLFFSFLRQVSG